MDMYKRLDRLTVAEAAERLGVKEQAVRKRIARGTLHSTKDEDGRVYVYIDPSDTDTKLEEENNSTSNSADSYTLIGSLEEQVAFLRREVEDWKEEARRKDTIIMSLTQRVPELEPASEQRESTASATEGEGSTHVSPTRTRETSEVRETLPSWWRRVFGWPRE